MDKGFKVYTKGGDSGKTSLIGGKRIPKYDLQVEAYGTIDELKAYTGLLYDFTDDLLCKKTLMIIIEKLFVAESLMACETYEHTLGLEQITDDNIIMLEGEIDRMTKFLKPLKSFILPGGHPTVSQIHIARCVCRRAERRVVTLQETATETVSTTMFEGQNGAAEHAVMFTPHNGPLLGGRAFNASEAGLEFFVPRRTALRTGNSGTRRHHCPAGAAQTSIVAIERLIAVWAHTGKERLGGSGQHPPHVHGRYGSRGLSDAGEEVVNMGAILGP